MRSLSTSKGTHLTLAQGGKWWIRWIRKTKKKWRKWTSSFQELSDKKSLKVGGKSAKKAQSVTCLASWPRSDMLQWDFERKTEASTPSHLQIPIRRPKVKLTEVEGFTATNVDGRWIKQLGGFSQQLTAPYWFLPWEHFTLEESASLLMAPAELYTVVKKIAEGWHQQTWMTSW